MNDATPSPRRAAGDRGRRWACRCRLRHRAGSQWAPRPGARAQPRPPPHRVRRVPERGGPGRPRLARDRSAGARRDHHHPLSPGQGRAPGNRAPAVCRRRTFPLPDRRGAAGGGCARRSGGGARCSGDGDRVGRWRDRGTDRRPGVAGQRRGRLPRASIPCAALPARQARWWASSCISSRPRPPPGISPASCSSSSSAAAMSAPAWSRTAS